MYCVMDGSDFMIGRSVIKQTCHRPSKTNIFFSFIILHIKPSYLCSVNLSYQSYKRILLILFHSSSPNWGTNWRLTSPWHQSPTTPVTVTPASGTPIWSMRAAGWQVTVTGESPGSLAGGCTWSAMHIGGCYRLAGRLTRWSRRTSSR